MENTGPAMCVIRKGAGGYNKSDYYGIECLECKRISYNPNDVKNVYCGNCHKFGHLVERPKE